jgi:hypothetical protein
MRTIALIGAILILPLPELTENAYAAKVGQRCRGTAGITCDQGLWCDAVPGKCEVVIGSEVLSVVRSAIVGNSTSL